MTNRRTNRALSSTRRWTAGILLASTLVTGGVGIHLADAYAAAQSGSVTASSSTPSGSTTSFGTSGSVSSSSNAASTTTTGS